MLNVKNLHISFENGTKTVVNNLSFSVEKGKTLAIVGESGSGKSMSSLAIMGLLPNSAIAKGEVLFKDRDLLRTDSNEVRKFRGMNMAMIFQEPMTALNPAMKCGLQCAEVLRLHLHLSKKEAKAEVIKLFNQVKIPNPERTYNAYPHALSGGQRQRVMIAMAISCKPDLLIADEPTTALDVTVQKEILNLLKQLQKDHNMGMIFISHDLGVVKHLADEVVVMYRGDVMESGAVNEVLENPKSSYTKGLLSCKPPLNAYPKRLPTLQEFMEHQKVDHTEVPLSEKESALSKMETESPILEVKQVDKWFGEKSWLNGDSRVHALSNVSFKVFGGETLGLVGESGCGKSTLGKCIVGLLKPEQGEIYYNGKDLLRLSGKERQALNKDIQVIFQDPFSSLNPRQKTGDCILEPIKVHNIEPAAKRKEKVEYLLEKVGLLKSDYDKYPHQFSGGQRQRVGIARALALKPKLIVCDESVSALDVSVQAQVLNLLNDLKEEFGFTYIFISHDLNVVKYMSDHLVVMNAGVVEEQGRAMRVFENPQKVYTQKLIGAVLD